MRRSATSYLHAPFIVKDWLDICGSKATMSGTHANVIMSGWENGYHPDNATTQASKIVERAFLRKDLTVSRQR
jgi:hypothetical protein